MQIICELARNIMFCYCVKRAVTFPEVRSRLRCVSKGSHY